MCMGNSHRLDKSMKILNTVKQHWVHKKHFWTEEKGGKWGVTFQR